MDGVCLEDVQRAYQTRDPSLPELVVALAQAADPPTKSVRQGELTYQSFLSELNSWSFRYYKSDEEKQTYRVESWKILTSPDAAVPLPDRLWLHQIVTSLWEANGPYERECLIKIIMTCPLKWGPWKALKRIFKESEASDDMEVYGALAVRFDMENSGYFYSNEVSRATLMYLVRRSWRHLRRKGESFSSSYADSAVEFLRHYNESTRWNKTWVANHIFYHEDKRYGQGSFMYWSAPSDLIKDRAFAEAWQRTPRPLFSLLERAQSEKVRKFAVDSLKTDFRTVLREVEASWVVRLAGVESATAHDFVVWLLKNVPKFEAASFREMGLHEPVLLLLESPSNDARAYAASYARTHARDLGLEELVRLTNNDHGEVRKLAFDLLRELDPREGVGLDWWGKMLGTQYGHDVAVDVLRKHFGSSELTAAWFKERLLSDTHKVVEFAKAQLPETHNVKALGAKYFTSLFDEDNLGSNAANFALEQLLRHFDVTQIDVDFWRRSLLHPLSSATIQRWISEEKFKANSLGVEFWRSLSYHLAWDEDEWAKALKSSGRQWASALSFNSNLARYARQILGDTRQFSPEAVGFEWLMSLVVRLESEYNQFAEQYLLSAFTPADFAPAGTPKDQGAAQGCEALWEMATGEGEEEEPRRTFAIKYLRQHHPGLGPELTGKALAAEATIPHEFFSFERVKPLMLESRPKLRKLGLELGSWELARWAPPLDEIVELCELRFADVTRFFERALLAEDIKENERFRLGRDKLTVSGVYRFCESLDKITRKIGMALIAKYDDLAVPQELFRLTESPDRQMRAFVIRRLWHLYRARGVTMHWSPTPVELQYTKSKKKTGVEYETGPGPAQRPEGVPVEGDELLEFLRRELFGIPPAKLSKDEASMADANESAGDGARAQVRPVAARKAKLSLIEVIRDLALEDDQFAQLVSPLLLEFMGSRGQSERAACLVALTRINQSHPQLNVWSEAR